MMQVRVTQAPHALTGDVRVPTDKSISHRAVLLASMADGTSRLVGVLDSADVRSTIGAVQQLGAIVEVLVDDERGLQLSVTGWGDRGPATPAAPIDCGNSGTTARLLMGVLAGWPVDVTLTGDESLSQRPMLRVAEPLRAMGADIETTEGGTLPARVRGAELTRIDYDSPVASAQVKSAVLLAALRAWGTTTASEPALSRDHTERMLPSFGVPVAVDAASRSASVSGPAVPTPYDAIVPADPSSAAFMVVAAMLVRGSHVRLPNVAVNPTRVAYLDVLRRMGAKVKVNDLPAMGGEPVGTIVVHASPQLQGVTVSAEEVPALIDEIPILALAATQATGTTRFEGVRELRVKESDRLEAVRAGLTALGADVDAGEDWLAVTGPTPLRGASIESLGDHRLAMTWAVAGLIAQGETQVGGFEAVEVSYPNFLSAIQELAGIA